MGCAASLAVARVPDADRFSALAPAFCASSLEGLSGDFHEQYKLARKLGQGSFGHVYAADRPALDEDAMPVAVKVFDLRAKTSAGRAPGTEDTKTWAMVEREVSLMRILPDCAQVVRLYDVFASDGLAYVVLEMCHGPLLSHLERMHALTEETLKPIFRDMLLALDTCHAAGVVHRDVKPDNFLVGGPENTVKLCDFGLSAVCRGASGRPEGIFGTPPYMAPEMLRGDAYDTKVDLWSLGVIAYVLLFGTWPYVPAELTGAAMKEAIRSGAPPRFRGRAGLADISSVCTAFVQALLRRRPADRLSAAQALKHRSFTAPWRQAAEAPCLRKTLNAAKRCGAFDLPGRARSPSPATAALDEHLVEVAARRRADASSGAPAHVKLVRQTSACASEVSTCAFSDSPSHSWGRRQT